MKKVIIFSMIFLFGIVSLNSCKKYEDGPGFSLLSKTARLTGDWKANEFTVNNEDFLETTYSESGISITLSRVSEVSINKNKTIQSTVETTTTTVLLGLSNTQNAVTTDSGTWDWSDNKETITTSFPVDGEENDETVFTILKLTNSEMILEAEDNGDDIRIVYEKK